MFFIELIMFDNDKENYEEFLLQFAKLKDFPHPKGLIPIFLQNNTQFCRLEAYLLFLLDRGVSEDQIIASNLIQSFTEMQVMVHNDIQFTAMQNFYGNLAKHAKAGVLIEKIKQTGISLPGLENHSLYGEKGKKCPISKKENHDVVRLEVLSDVDFKVLIQLFGISIFKKVCSDTEKTIPPREKNELQQLSSTKLVELIDELALGFENYSVFKKNSKVFKKLAVALSKDQIEALKKQQTFALLYLAPYLNDDYSLMVCDVLKPCIESEGKIKGKAFPLIVLFKKCYKIDLILANQLYKALLDCISSHENPLILEKLKQPEYAHFFYLIENKIEELKKSFNDLINKSTLSKETLSNSIKEWEKIWYRINNLTPIRRKHTFNFPIDIYEFYGRLIQEKLKLEKDIFNVVEFMQSIIPEEHIDGNGIPALERALIEILAYNPSSFGCIKSFLETTARKHGLWMIHPYRTGTLLIKACKQDNLELVKKIFEEKKHVIPSLQHIKALKMAGRATRWDILNFLLTTIPEIELNKDLIGEIFQKAACSGQLDVIKTICSMNPKKRPKYTFIKEVYELVKEGPHEALTQYLKEVLQDTRPSNRNQFFWGGAAGEESAVQRNNRCSVQ